MGTFLCICLVLLGAPGAFFRQECIHEAMACLAITWMKPPHLRQSLDVSSKAASVISFTLKKILLAQS